MCCSLLYHLNMHIAPLCNLLPFPLLFVRQSFLLSLTHICWSETQEAKPCGTLMISRSVLFLGIHETM